MIGGHGHVVPRPDGAKARCGGPEICPECSQDLAAQRMLSASVPSAPVPSAPVPSGPEYTPEQVAEQALRRIFEGRVDYQRTDWVHIGTLLDSHAARGRALERAARVESEVRKFARRWLPIVPPGIGEELAALALALDEEN